MIAEEQQLNMQDKNWGEAAIICNWIVRRSASIPDDHTTNNQNEVDNDIIPLNHHCCQQIKKNLIVDIG